MALRRWQAGLFTLVAGCSGATGAEPIAASPPTSPEPTAPATDPPPPVEPASAAPSASASPSSGELIGVPIASKPADPEPASEPGSDQAVELFYVSAQPGKHPQKTLYFDVTLRNKREEPRWFVLPLSLRSKEKSRELSARSAKAFVLSGQGRVVVGRFEGDKGFSTILLPAGAQVKIKKLPIECSLPSLKECAIPIQAAHAQKLTLGKDGAQAWLGVDPLSDAGAEVSFEGARAVLGKRAPGEVSVNLTDASRVELQFIIGTGESVVHR